MYKFKPQLPKKTSVTIPNELWFLILDQCANHTLLKVRLICSKFKTISNELLTNRLKAPLVELFEALRESQLELADVEREKLPQLEHYKGFLNVPSIHENLSEVIWYAAAPPEVQSVCECLVRLYLGSNQPPVDKMEWNDIRRVMKKSEFKLWVHCLSTNVEFIKISATRQVENIIRVDPMITYERLREVSMAGYRLLIIVAASLQYSSISDEISSKKAETDMLLNTVEFTSLFMDAIRCK